MINIITNCEGDETGWQVENVNEIANQMKEYYSTYYSGVSVDTYEGSKVIEVTYYCVESSEEHTEVHTYMEVDYNV